MMLALVQSSIVVALALCAAGLMRKQSAAVRHFILSVGLIAAIVVPFVTVPASMRPSPATSWRPLPGGEAPLPLGEAAAQQRARVTNTTNFSLLNILWATGSGIAIVLLVASAIRIKILVSRSKPLDLANMQLKRRVRLLQNDRAVLGAWGVLRPIVLLPRDAETWTPERLRIVLTHEFAHIRRFDWLVQMIAELARAAYWFNPLLWLLCRRLRAESEYACDDVVIGSGVDPKDYAAHLLELVRTLKNSGRAWSPVLAMAQPPNLERRFVAMLNPSLNHRPAHRTAVVIVCIIAAGLVLPLAAMRAPKEPAPAAQGLADGSLSGKVYDPSGAVIPTVTITLRSDRIEEQTTSGETGEYEFRALPEGQYALTVQFRGFATYRSGRIDIKPNQAQQHNVHLLIGNIAERVTVSGTGQKKLATPTGTPQRIRVGGSVVAANLVAQVKPVYPQKARDEGIEGTVHLQGVIGKDGTLISLHVIGGAKADLANAALEAVRQWRYRPTMLNGEPVEVLTTIDVEFQLGQ